MDAVADDLCETAGTPCGKFCLRSAMTARPRLDRRLRVRTEGPLHLLQLLLAGEGAQRFAGAIEWEGYFEPALEDENERLFLARLRLPRFNAADAVRGVDNEITDSQSQCHRGSVCGR